MKMSEYDLRCDMINKRLDELRETLDRLEDGGRYVYELHLDKMMWELDYIIGLANKATTLGPENMDPCIPEDPPKIDPKDYQP